MARIMIVDDEEHVLSALKRVFGREEWIVEAFTDQTAALDRAYEAVFDVVVSDYRMPGLNGADLLTEFSRRQPDTTRIILSGQTDHEGLMAAINQAKIFRFIEKPWDDDDLKSAVQEGIEAHVASLEEKNLVDEARQAKGQISGEEAELRRLERSSPGITKVERDTDGAIILPDKN